MRTVIDLARTTNPGDAAELDAIEADYDITLGAACRNRSRCQAGGDPYRRIVRELDRAGRTRRVPVDRQCRQYRESPARRGSWGGLGLVREGINWRHNLSGRADYQETEGVVTREQYLAAYEPNYKLSERALCLMASRSTSATGSRASRRAIRSRAVWGYDVLTGESMDLVGQGRPGMAAHRTGRRGRQQQFLQGLPRRISTGSWPKRSRSHRMPARWCNRQPAR